jgi:hypothetical protein
MQPKNGVVGLHSKWRRRSVRRRSSKSRVGDTDPELGTFLEIQGLSQRIRDFPGNLGTIPQNRGEYHEKRDILGN